MNPDDLIYNIFSRIQSNLTGSQSALENNSLKSPPTRENVIEAVRPVISMEQARHNAQASAHQRVLATDSAQNILRESVSLSEWDGKTVKNP